MWRRHNVDYGSGALTSFATQSKVGIDLAITLICHLKSERFLINLAEDL